MHIPTDCRRISMIEELGEHFGYMMAKMHKRQLRFCNELMRKIKPGN